MSGNGLPKSSVHGRSRRRLDESRSERDEEHEQVHHQEGYILLREELEGAQVSESISNMAVGCGIKSRRADKNSVFVRF